MKYRKTKITALLSLFMTGITLFTLESSADLIHRYNFNEPPGSTAVTDSAGNADGQIAQLVNTSGPIGTPVTFDGSQAILDGTGGYIDLPNGLVSGLTNVTIEMWVTWGGGDAWQRFFDFGSITNNTGGPGHLEDLNSTTTGSLRGGDYWGTRYMFLSPSAGGTGFMRFTISDDYFNAERPILNDSLTFPTFTEVHVTVTYGAGGARLFYNGQLIDSGFVTPENFIPLSSVEDVNVWLGRSTYGADPMFAGYFDEFRIHNTLLTAQQIAASDLGGPDDTNSYDPGTPTALSMTVANSMIVGGIQIPQFSGTFSGVGTIALGTQDLTSLTSSATNVVKIDEGGRLVGVSAGSATITATLGTQVQTATINVSATVPELKNRWSFNESAGTTTLVDSVGGQNATIVAGPTGTNITVGSGQAVLPGANSYANAAYIDLPDGILSSRTNITVETWFTWAGPNNQNNGRIFDFGSSTKPSGPNSAGNGWSYFFLSPRSTSGIRLAVRTNNAAENPSIQGPLMSLNTQHHIAVVYAPDSRLSRIYLDGIPVATGDAVIPLSAFQGQDTNNWIGVSQWNDPVIVGSMNEFRIWEGALSDLDIALDRQAGPDALPGAPGNLVSVSLQVSGPLLIGNNAAVQATLRGNFQNITSVDITGLSGVSLRSVNTNIFEVNATGGLAPRNVGAANLVASYQNLSATTSVSVLAPTALRLGLTNNLYAGGVPATATLLADFSSTITNVDVSGFAGVTRTSSDTSVATITAAGVITPLKSGTTTLTSVYGGLTNETVLNVTVNPNAVPVSLAHRYNFDGTGTTLTDLVGGVNGTVINTTLDGSGALTLVNSNIQSTATDLQWVDFGQSLVPSGATSLTLEAWFTPGAYIANNADGGNWLFNLNDGVAGAATAGKYLFYSPWGAGGSSDRQVTRWAKGGYNNEVGYIHNSGLNSQSQHHVAVVVDGANQTISLYSDGAFLGRQGYDSTWNLADLTTAWLAKSSYPDIGFFGSITEFRVYQGALLPENLAANIAAGPDTVVTISTRPNLRAVLSGSNIQITWPTNAADFTLESSSTLGSGASWSSSGLPTATVVGDQFQVTVPVNGNAFYRLKK